MANVKFDSDSRVSLSNADSGSYNTVFGKLAGNLLASGDTHNVFIGEDVADADMTNAVENTAVGYAALSSLTQGDENTCIGRLAGRDIDTGSGNVMIGSAAGYQVDEAVSECVIIGRGAFNAQADAGTGADGTGSDGTVAIGYGAGASITSGSANVVIGYKAGEDITDADYNTLIGYEAGANIISGHSNICIGREAGKSLDNSDHNIAIGRDAMNDSTHDDSKYNIGIGSYTLDAIGGNLAEKNIAIGYQAGSGITTGDDNTIVGYRAGQVTTELAGGIDNTLIGSGAITSAPGGNNQTVVGAHTSGQADNSVTLGNASVTAVYAAQDSDAIVHAGGIVFDASGETLGDYEEGLHDYQCYTSNGDSGSAAWQKRGGYGYFSYVLVGKICHVQGRFEFDGQGNASSSSSHYVYFTLPFTSASLTDVAGTSAGTIAMLRTPDTGVKMSDAVVVVHEGVSKVDLVCPSIDGSAEQWVTAFSDSAWEGYFQLTYRVA